MRTSTIEKYHSEVFLLISYEYDQDETYANEIGLECYLEMTDRI